MEKMSSAVGGTVIGSCCEQDELIMKGTSVITTALGFDSGSFLRKVIEHQGVQRTSNRMKSNGTERGTVAL